MHAPRTPNLKRYRFSEIIVGHFASCFFVVHKTTKCLPTAQNSTTTSERRTVERGASLWPPQGLGRPLTVQSNAAPNTKRGCRALPKHWFWPGAGRPGAQAKRTCIPNTYGATKYNPNRRPAACCTSPKDDSGPEPLAFSTWFSWKLLRLVDTCASDTQQDPHDVVPPAHILTAFLDRFGSESTKRKRPPNGSPKRRCARYVAHNTVWATVWPGLAGAKGAAADLPPFCLARCPLFPPPAMQPSMRARRSLRGSERMWRLWPLCKSGTGKNQLCENDGAT